MTKQYKKIIEYGYIPTESNSPTTTKEYFIDEDGHKWIESLTTTACDTQTDALPRCQRVGDRIYLF